MGQRYQRLIQTSAIAGVIILILVGIFAWVKCARWWRNRKTQMRKQIIKDLLARREYVTVPVCFLHVLKLNERLIIRPLFRRRRIHYLLFFINFYFDFVVQHRFES